MVSVMANKNDVSILRHRGKRVWLVSSSCWVLGAKISSFSHSKIFLLMVVGLVVCGELLLVCGGRLFITTTTTTTRKTRKHTSRKIGEK